MKILITAAGGGHFSPALAVMKALKHADIFFIGRKYAFEGDTALSLEYRTVKELAIPFGTITAGRLQRTVSIRSFLSLLKIPLGILQAFTLVRKERPDVIVSFGGYVTLPVTVAGFLLNIPVVIHEQTMKAGLANKIAGKFAATICLTFPTSARYFPKGKTVITGNPLRKELLENREIKPFFSENLPIIFVTGGSLGSHALNVLIEESLEKLTAQYQIIHQTGDAREFQDYERLVKKKTALSDTVKKRYLPMRFMKPEEMASAMKQATLIVSRSGISTIMELLYYQKPALLIPLPHGQKNEQLDNARFLEQVGLGRVKKQADVNAQTMYTEIERMIDEVDTFRMKPEYATVIKPDATEKIVSVVLSYAEKLSSKTQ